jgi:MFS-type transporter involved in bile tolerance (Atg22 family)
LALTQGGQQYDRIGLRGLIVLPVLATIIPFLSFATRPLLVWIGALVWGAVMGIHESTMRAAVADLVPPARRGAGYGAFTAVYGLAWLVGGGMIGYLYSRSVSQVEIFVVIVQLIALVAFWPVARGRS